MSSNWIDILASADDATLGETLIRLAEQAAAMHREQLAGRDAEISPADGTVGRSVVHPQRAVRTEAGR